MSKHQAHAGPDKYNKALATTVSDRNSYQFALEYQGRGLGTALVRAAVNAACSLGAPALLLEGSPAYYSALTSVQAVPFGFPMPSVRVPEPAFLAIHNLPRLRVVDGAHQENIHNALRRLSLLLQLERCVFDTINLHAWNTCIFTYNCDRVLRHIRYWLKVDPMIGRVKSG